MNSRYVGTAIKDSVSKPRQEALFAAEVYRDEDEAPPSKDGTSEELAQLRTELRGEARALRLALSRPARVPAELLAELATLRAEVSELLAAPKRGDAAAAAIRARGIEGGAASVLARFAKTNERGKDKGASSRGEGASCTEKLRTACAELVQIAPSPLSLAKAGPTLIALVGPAGVGKTTTAAKLAAQARMARKTVALVSCDAFRVGAMDQLGKYAELMDARFHTATSPEELMEIVRNEEADVIIVDTSGRPVEPNAAETQLASHELRNAGRIGRTIEVLLCVPAALRASDATRVHRDFAATAPTALAVTKLDETDAPAGIVHAVFATRLRVSTLCAGQRVPEDIAAATDEAIADYLFPRERSSADANVSTSTTRSSTTKKSR
jgi:flagellar biosynthesis protein FlhF